MLASRGTSRRRQDRLVFRPLATRTTIEQLRSAIRAAAGDAAASEVMLRLGLSDEGSSEQVVVDGSPGDSAHFFLGQVGGSLGSEAISLGVLLESTSDAVVLLDRDDVVRFWSQGAERMFGWAREEVVGQTFERIVPDDLRERGEMAWIHRRVLDHGALDNHLTRRLSREGEIRWVSLTRTLLRGASGQALGSMSVLRDLTEYRRTEEALERARHLARIGEMAATVAHDIKNPLAAIHAALQYIDRPEVPFEERREVIGEVSGEVHRVDETIQDLLRFARRVPPRRERVGVHAVVEDVLAELHLSLDLAHHMHELAIPAELEVSVDPSMVRRILRNLLANASQAMEGPGTLRIEAGPVDGVVVVEVIDQGPGVPAEVQGTLFEPFVTSKARGTGLGLSIARRYAEDHGGSLELAETGRAGSRFRLTLPG